jgi:hypothetical protein
MQLEVIGVPMTFLTLSIEMPEEMQKRFIIQSLKIYIKEPVCYCRSVRLTGIGCGLKFSNAFIVKRQFVKMSSKDEKGKLWLHRNAILLWFTDQNIDPWSNEVFSLTLFKY